MTLDCIIGFVGLLSFFYVNILPDVILMGFVVYD